MNKIKVYIDFEIISNSLEYEINSKKIPYAYTMGIFVGKDFKTKIYVVNFNNVDIKDIYNKLNKKITWDIRHILKKFDFKVSGKSVEFAAFNHVLEKEILKKVFKYINVIDISKGERISLEKATEREMGKKNYFKELKEVVNKNLSSSFIEKKGLDKSGALAGFAGYILYKNVFPSKNDKYNLEINSKILLKEIKIYSEDDVVRMKIIVSNYKLFHDKAKRWNKIIKKNNSNNKIIKKNKIIIDELKKINPELKIKDYLKKVCKDYENIKIKNLKGEIL